MATQQSQIVRDLTHAIRTGQYAEGSWLPSVDDLAKQTQFSRHAVARAFQTLSSQGIVRSIKKKGTQVLRRPPTGRVLFMLSDDAHTSLLLQDPLAVAFIEAGFDVEIQPYLFRSAVGFDRLRHLARQSASDTVLLTLSQERIPSEFRAEWESIACKFKGRVGFQIEDINLLPQSVVVEMDPVASARIGVEHLLSLGHRRIGIIAGGTPRENSWATRRAAAAIEILAVTNAQCLPFYYGIHAPQGYVDFVRQNRCTAWWTINDFQVIDTMHLFRQAGFHVPRDLSILGGNDTPWATAGDLGISTLSMNPQGIARALVENTLDILNKDSDSDPDPDPDPVPSILKRYIRPVLVPRDSTAQAPVT